MVWQFVRFLIVGGFNTLIGLSVIFATKAFLHMDDIPANMLGYAFGLIFSFILNRSWTFRDRGAVALSSVRFMLVFAIAYLCNLSTVLVLLKQFGVNGYVAQTVGVVPYTLSFFFLSKYFVFRMVSTR